jgi:hypothetical protein
LKRLEEEQTFKNRLLKTIFVSKDDEMSWGYRKLHRKKFRSLDSQSHIVGVIKLKTMRCVVDM